VQKLITSRQGKAPAPGKVAVFYPFFIDYLLQILALIIIKDNLSQIAASVPEQNRSFPGLSTPVILKVRL
jgi:hypothetical protein